MTKKERTACKEKLLEFKRDLQDKIYGTETSQGLAQSDSDGGVSAMPSHLADIGTDSFDTDMRLNLASGESELLQLVDRALEKVDGKEYGKCETCGDKIGLPRMMAMPYVLNCIACQEKLEEDQNF